jgi:hypothetical protein
MLQLDCYSCTYLHQRVLIVGVGKERAATGLVGKLGKHALAVLQGHLKNYRSTQTGTPYWHIPAPVIASLPASVLCKN